MEASGAVFLPAQGARHGFEEGLCLESGFYWSSSPNLSDLRSVSCLEFSPYNNVELFTDDPRGIGCSIRLIRTYIEMK